MVPVRPSKEPVTTTSFPTSFPAFSWSSKWYQTLLSSSLSTNRTPFWETIFPLKVSALDCCCVNDSCGMSNCLVWGVNTAPQIRSDIAASMVAVLLTWHLEIKQDLENPARHGSLRHAKAAFP